MAVSVALHRHRRKTSRDCADSGAALGAQILLLDEATSALDSESEEVVQEALDRVMQVCVSASVITVVLLCVLTLAEDHGRPTS